MITYLCLGTNDLARAARFYDATLDALGYARCAATDESEPEIWVGWGTSTEPSFWLCTPFNGQPAAAGNGSMVAFSAQSWKQVEAFHDAALSAGGTSEGAPGLRPHYNPDFYAAYVRDPDGNKVAAICRGFTEPQRD
jgi:catechol 2,3-dioxygenase-like lactoylglutathione lyase family enzyme